MRWRYVVLGGCVLAAGTMVSCDILLRRRILEGPEPTGTLVFARMHEAEREGESLGAAIGVGDWDGDGRADYAIGAPSAGQQPRARGQAREAVGRCRR